MVALERTDGGVSTRTNGGAGTCYMHCLDYAAGVVEVMIVVVILEIVVFDVVIVLDVVFVHVDVLKAVRGALSQQALLLRNAWKQRRNRRGEAGVCPLESGVVRALAVGSGRAMWSACCRVLIIFSDGEEGIADACGEVDFR